MPEIRVMAERRIAAPSGKVYEAIRDYHEHHVQFLPPSFTNLRVHEGGVGAGTVISYMFKAGPRERNYTMKITEPEPGRVLQESDQGSSLITTWTVDPVQGGTNVKLQTHWNGTGGIFEKIFAPRALKKIYDDELQRLDEYVRTLA